VIFLATTHEGLLEAVTLAGPTHSPVWCGAGLADATDVDAMRRHGRALTVFAYALDSADAIEDALATIAEHHPGERVWIEWLPEHS